MPSLTPTRIAAKVRIDGTSHSYVPRAFELMLDRDESLTKQLKEATRILKQIGYEPRAVRFQLAD